jgi:uncharacterized protein
VNRLLCYALWLCLVAGCSSSTVPTYYALSLSGDQVPSRQITEGPVLVVDRVVLPEYLNDLGVAFQQDDVQIVTANQARWAEALDKQLTRSLVLSLSQHLDRVQVLEGPMARGQSWHLSVEVTSFQGRFDGQAIVAGRWVLQRNEEAYSQAFQQQVPLQQDGYPALIRALRTGWQTELGHLAAAIHGPLTKSK